MGCSNGKMVQVAPQNTKESTNLEIKPDTDTNNNTTKSSEIINKRINSAASNTSGHSKDSAFIDGDADSITSASKSIRGNSGKLILCYIMV